jgi:hypothetical protein
MFYNIILAAGLTLALSLPASAEDQATDLLADREWSIIVSPYVWAASLDGDASLAGLDSNVDIPFSDIFKHLDLAAMGNVEVTNGLFGFYFDGQYVQTSQDEDLADFEVGLKIKTTILAAGAYYRVYDLALGGDTVFGEPRHFTVEPTVGIRWTKLEAHADAGFTSANKSADWLDPFVGMRLSTDLSDRWNLAGEADIGGFDIGSKLAINAQAYLGYRTYMFNHPTILRVGSRVLSQDYETDDFTGNKFRWDVTQHGPVLGFSMRF